jgi:hypothetical protein
VRAVLFALVCSFLCAAPAFAGTQDGAVVAIHGPSVFIKGDPCIGYGPPCTDTDVNLERGWGWVWLFVGRGDPAAGSASVSCGVSYPEDLLVWDWALCGDFQVSTGAWPDSGTGNRISWDADTNCQLTVLGTDGVHAETGAFYLSSYVDAFIEVTPNTAEGETALVVTDCSGEESELTTRGGSLGLNNAVGYNPCAEDVPVRGTTWGRLKTQY